MTGFKLSSFWDLFFSSFCKLQNIPTFHSFKTSWKLHEDCAWLFVWFLDVLLCVTVFLFVVFGCCCLCWCVLLCVDVCCCVLVYYVVVCFCVLLGAITCHVSEIQLQNYSIRAGEECIRCKIIIINLDITHNVFIDEDS